MPLFPGKFSKTILIISAGRTGTTALAQYFDLAYDEVRGLHEPRPTRSLRRLSVKGVAGKATAEQLERSLRRARRSILAKVQEPIYLESNGFLSGFLTVLDDVYEEPLVVHIVRNPRSHIASAINFGSYSGIKRLVSALIPYWTLKPDYVCKGEYLAWRNMSRIERAIWSWRYTNAWLNQGEKRFGQRYMRVRFEELFAEEGNGLLEFAKRLGLPGNPVLKEAFAKGAVNPSKGSASLNQLGWDGSNEEILQTSAGELMRLYGYE